jgi:hypothetical protein
VKQLRAAKRSLSGTGKIASPGRAMKKMGANLFLPGKSKNYEDI